MKPEERYYGAQPKIAIAMGLIPRSLLHLEGILREEVDRKVGASPKSDLQRWIQNAAA